MKMLLSIFAILIFAFKLTAADSETNRITLLKISAFAATNHYGEEIIVTGKVAQVTVRPTVTFLNLVKAHPKSPFTVVIFHGHSSFYGDANVLKGRSIEIEGKIKNYKGAPEIILDSTNQLKVLGVTNLDLFLKPKFALPSTNAPDMQSTNLSEIL